MMTTNNKNGENDSEASALVCLLLSTALNLNVSSCGANKVWIP